MKKCFLSIFILFGIPLFSGAIANFSVAQAAIIYGAQTYTRTIYAPSYYQIHNSTVDGGQDSIYAHSEITDEWGSAEAESTLGLDINLKAKAAHISGTSDGAIANANAIQGYTYTGAGPSSLALTAALTGSIHNPAASNNVYLSADIHIYKPINFGYYYDPGTLLGELMADLFYSDDYENSSMHLDLLDTISNGTDSDSVILNLEAGQSFFVVSSLTARASNQIGSWADAYSTLDLSFDDTANLTLGAESTTVPIPGSIWLMGAGFMGLIGFVRNRQKN